MARICGAVAGLVMAMRVGVAEEPVQLPVLNTSFHGETYTSCQIDPARQDLRLYWADAQGNLLGNFTALNKQVAAEGGRLLFAANAGMFQPDSKPVGLLVEKGKEKSPLNLANGYGNFYLKPNGVFLINTYHQASIIESGSYLSLSRSAWWATHDGPLFATQSGPLLVYRGKINPAFLPDSKNRKIRSGVGVTAKGQIIFALSRNPVTFHEFADLFRAKFQCPNALYLDGDISNFYTGTLDKDSQHHFGPMFALVAGTSHEGVTAAPATP
jgi:uncharacterized protein YigE (DUF2233 family)